MPSPYKIREGSNQRAIGVTIVTTGPGVTEKALVPGETLPEPPSDAEVSADPHVHNKRREKTSPPRPPLTGRRRTALQATPACLAVRSRHRASARPPRL